MSVEIIRALEELEAEKGIPKEYMYEKIEAALVSAFKKEYGISPKEFRDVVTKTVSTVIDNSNK